MSYPKIPDDCLTMEGHGRLHEKMEKLATKRIIEKDDSEIVATLEITKKPDASFMADGECRNLPPETLICGSGKQAQKAAKAICGMCKVEEICLDYHIQTKNFVGIAGGKNSSERKKIAKEIAKKSK